MHCELRVSHNLHLSAHSLTMRLATGFDIVGFGHKDGLIGAYCVAAVNALAQLKEWRGDAAGANTSRAMHRRAVATYNAELWNESAGFYSDWKDENGLRRNYLYTWNNLLTIDPLAGIANSTQASAIIRAMDARYAALRSEFGKDAGSHGLWCPPSNMLPAERYDLQHNGTDCDQADYPHYENGNCFLCYMGYELSGRALAGTGRPALEVFRTAMGNFNSSKMTMLSRFVALSVLLTQKAFSALLRAEL